MRPETATPADVGVKNILELKASMFELYGNAAQIFQKNILAEHPVILGLFSGAGGRFILYRPGIAPLEAAPVPMVYQLIRRTQRNESLIRRHSRRPRHRGNECTSRRATRQSAAPARLGSARAIGTPQPPSRAGTKQFPATLLRFRLA